MHNFETLFEKMSIIYWVNFKSSTSEKYNFKNSTGFENFHCYYYHISKCGIKTFLNEVNYPYYPQPFCCLNTLQFYSFLFYFFSFLVLIQISRERGKATVNEEDENRSKIHNPQQFDEEYENPNPKLSRLKKKIVERVKQYGFIAGEGENPNLLS